MKIRIKRNQLTDKYWLEEKGWFFWKAIGKHDINPYTLNLDLYITFFNSFEEAKLQKQKLIRKHNLNTNGVIEESPSINEIYKKDR